MTPVLLVGIGCILLFFTWAWSVRSYTEKYEAESIPKRIWQTYKTKALPKEAKECQQSWIAQKDWDYKLFDDSDILKFMKDHFSSKIVQCFQGFPLGVMRADMWRYCVLYIYGGVYSDVDSVALTPLDQWGIRPQDKLIIGLENETHFCQWTIVAVPRHPLLKALIDTIVDDFQKGIDTRDEHFVHKHTGPGIWTRVIHNVLQYPIEQKAGHTFYLYQNDPEHRKRAEALGIRLEDRTFFSKKMVRNMYGSTQFRDGYTSWMTERDQLLTA